MKIIVLRSEILEALKKINNYITNKTSNTIFTYAKLESVNGKLIVTGGNDQAVIEVETEVSEVLNNGALLVPFKKLNDFLKKSKADFVTIEQLDEKVNIQANNIDYKLLTQDTNNYPNTPIEHYENIISIDIDSYKRMIKNTTFAVATSDSRPILKGVNVRNYHNALRFAATDSHRLGLYDYDLQTEAPTIDITLDGKTLEKSVKVLNKTTKELSLSIGNMFTLIKFDNVNLYIKNIEGNYPDINRLIDIDTHTHATINTTETIEAVDMLSTIIKEDRNNAITMQLNGKIELNANSPEHGSMSAKLTGEKQGDDLKISFNAKYFNDALKALDEKNTYIGFNGSMRPFIAQSEDRKALQLILPVRTF